MNRPHDRKADELRAVTIQPGFTVNPQGSVLMTCGRTMVLCTAMVEDKTPSFLKGTGEGWVTAEYSLLPASTDTRSPREASRGKITGRTSEIQRLIGRSLRAVVDMTALGERTIWLDCDVLQADGGTRTAAITGAFVALCLAAWELKQQGVIRDFPVRDYLAAVSVGILQATPLLDLEYVEDSVADVDMNIVMTGAGKYVEIQGTAEAAPFDRAELDALLALGEAGIRRLMELQRAALGEEIHHAIIDCQS
ncbi:MAG: ribonuclease PH [Syntrophomonadaceae bacterium]|nr:ribonuclease PH [Syntrophomonadaceae bacterium]